MTQLAGTLDHITRPPLPWRIEPHLTECGMNLEGLDGRLITFPALQARVKDIGLQRAAFTTCMTCWETGRRHYDALTDPIRVLGRECTQLEWVDITLSYQLPDQPTQRQRTHERDRGRKQRLALELEALAALVAAHRDEFDQYILDEAETVSLTARRQARATRGGRRG